MLCSLEKIQYTFDDSNRTELCEIMSKNQSDKGKLQLTVFYYSIFKSIREKQLRVFELGLGTNNINIPSNMGPQGTPGASLYGWSEFFPNSNIFGADIDTDILFNTDKIKTFRCDQTNLGEIKKMWNKKELKGLFDIIIEDGLHTVPAQVCFLENSIHKLAPQGYYIIEDIHNESETEWKKIIKKWKKTYTNLKFQLLQIQSLKWKAQFDNHILVIKNVL